LVQSEVHFQYSLYQDLLLGRLPLGSGSGDLVVQGFIGLDVDLSMVGAAAISDCNGKFGFSSLKAEIEVNH